MKNYLIFIKKNKKLLITLLILNLIAVITLWISTKSYNEIYITIKEHQNPQLYHPSFIKSITKLPEPYFLNLKAAIKYIQTKQEKINIKNISPFELKVNLKTKSNDKTTIVEVINKIKNHANKIQHEQQKKTLTNLNIQINFLKNLKRLSESDIFLKELEIINAYRSYYSSIDSTNKYASRSTIIFSEPKIKPAKTPNFGSYILLILIVSTFITAFHIILRFSKEENVLE